MSIETQRPMRICVLHPWAAWLAATTLVAATVGCSSTSSSKASTMRLPWSKKPEVPAAPAGYKGSKAGDRDPFLNPSGKEIPPPDSLGQRVPQAGARTADGIEQDKLAVRAELGAPIALVSARRDPDEIAFAGYVDDTRDILKPEAAPRSYKYIVLHQSNGEAGSLESIDRVHRDVLGWESCGYHFVIGNGRGAADGRIETSPRWRLQKAGAHVTGRAIADFNSQGIGVCLIGDFDKDRPSPRQIEATRTLVGYLMRTYNIPPYRILTHGEVNDDASHGRQCPGVHFQKDLVVPAVRLTDVD